MVRPVSLSDPAFAALRKEKRTGESDSDVILRLVREVRETRKDPWAFVRYRAKPVRSWEALESGLTRMRETETRRRHRGEE